MKSTIALALLLLVSPSFAQEDAAKKETAKQTPETIEIKARPITLVETFGARVEAKKMTELRTTMDVWTSLITEQVAPQGTEVQPGDVVLKFEMDKIDDQLKSAEQDLQLSQLGLHQAEEELALTGQLNQLDQQLADRTWDRLQQDVKYFFDVEEPLSKRSADMRLKSSQYSVENAQEELDQLEKMYKEDEITEESEEIVLKRARRTLEQAKFYLESTEAGVKHTLDVDIPQRGERKELAPTGRTRI